MNPGNDVRKFVRARRLLAATLDNQRAIFGEISRNWIKSEVEQKIRISEIPPVMRYHDGVKLDRIECPPIYNKEKPSSVKKREPRINTNRLPKAESIIAAHILAGTILYGTRLYGAGPPAPDKEVPPKNLDSKSLEPKTLDNDIIIAAMICDTIGYKDRCSALLPEEFKLIDDDYILDEFGEGVLRHIHRLRKHLKAFDQALEKGETSQLKIPPEYANAIAAKKAGILRLTARLAGDGIFGKLDDAKRDELRKGGIDPGEPNAVFPERQFLEHDYKAAKAAVNLKGVDKETVKQPIEEVLLRSVDNVLRYGIPLDQLIGRFGTGVHNVHITLPLMERYSPINRKTADGSIDQRDEIEGPFALGTLHITSLEVTRYLHKARRKGIGTGAGHSFMVAAGLESLIGSELNVSIIAGADCHDVVEDGGLDVSGYNQTLDLFAARFGSPLAALVAEVTDSITKSDGPRKAEAFLGLSCLPFAKDVYNIGKLDELRIQATNPDVPYTLSGVFIKVVDTGITHEEGIRDPDMMTGPWRHSGARIFWDQYSKGNIMRPLLQRLSIEIQLSQTDPFYYKKDGAVPQAFIRRIKTLLNWSFDVADQYMVQSLCILAWEYKLTEKQRHDLLRAFTNDSRNQAGFEAFLNALLDDDRLDTMVRERGFAATYRLNKDKSVERDLAKLAAYRDSALWRQATRQKLGLNPLSEKGLNDVIHLYDLVTGS